MSALPRYVERLADAEWQEGQIYRQSPSRQWAVTAVKGEISEEQWAAGCRAVRDCAAATGVSSGNQDSGRVDGGGGGDYGAAARTTACRTLQELSAAASEHAFIPNAGVVVDAIARLKTLSEAAVSLGLWRKMGERPAVPDVRAVRDPIRRVLDAMANYYAAC